VKDCCSQHLDSMMALIFVLQKGLVTGMVPTQQRAESYQSLVKKSSAVPIPVAVAAAEHVAVAAVVAEHVVVVVVVADVVVVAAVVVVVAVVAA
jgi:hypothetical protein